MLLTQMQWLREEPQREDYKDRYLEVGWRTRLPARGQGLGAPACVWHGCVQLPGLYSLFSAY